jgi:hypothetical protein
MRSAAIPVATLTLWLWPGIAGTALGQTESSVVVSASFGSRTALDVSTRTLDFDVSDPSTPAIASVEFTAAARTAAGAPVVLSIEPLRAIQGPGGAADVELHLTFDGHGEGLLAGIMNDRGPAAAGRWIGSGHRTGRLVFRLRAAARGAYTVPIRLVLTTP